MGWEWFVLAESRRNWICFRAVGKLRFRLAESTLDFVIIINQVADDFRFGDMVIAHFYGRNSKVSSFGRNGNMLLSQFMEAMKHPMSKFPHSFVRLDGNYHVDKLIGLYTNPDGLLFIHC